MGIMLQIKKLTKHFGGVIACQNLDFAVEASQIVGVIGPNGSGKTTFFNLVTGVYAPSSGEIIYQGEPIHGKSPDNVVLMGISRTFQNIRLFKKLSLLDNVVIALDAHHANYGFMANLFQLGVVRRNEKQLKARAMEFLGIVGLENKAFTSADSLPYGLQRKLEIARALALSPKLLLLDEPAAGMNPEESMDLAGLIRRIKEMFSLTVILIEHHMNVIMDLCDNIVVMNYGEKIAEGPPEHIQKDSAVIKAYLGGEYRNVARAES